MQWYVVKLIQILKYRLFYCQQNVVELNNRCVALSVMIRLWLKSSKCRVTNTINLFRKGHRDSRQVNIQVQFPLRTLGKKLRSNPILFCIMMVVSFGSVCTLINCTYRNDLSCDRLPEWLNSYVEYNVTRDVYLVICSYVSCMHLSSWKS
jgi:hypothetical protein